MPSLIREIGLNDADGRIRAEAETVSSKMRQRLWCRLKNLK